MLSHIWLTAKITFCVLVFLLGIYDHEPCGLLRIYINIFYITLCSYIRKRFKMRFIFDLDTIRSYF